MSEALFASREDRKREKEEKKKKKIKARKERREKKKQRRLERAKRKLEREEELMCAVSTPIWALADSPRSSQALRPGGVS